MVQDIELRYGLSEEYDAIVLVASEETGKISFVIDGKIIRNMSKETLKQELKRRLERKMSKELKKIIEIKERMKEEKKD